MIKKIFVIMITILTIATLTIGCSSKVTQDKSLELIKEKGKIVIGLDDSFPPMGYRDDNNDLVGFDIDLAKELSKRMGVKVVFKPVEWDGIVLTLVNKNIDLIWNGMTITEERKEKISFSKPYLGNKQIIIVNKNSKIKSKNDLNNKTIGVQLESSSWYALNEDKQTLEILKEIRQYSNNVEALLDLKAGRIDAVVSDEILGRYYIQKSPEDYTVLQEDFGDELYGIGIRKEDVSLKEEIDRILNEMFADGTAAEISKKWFGEDILIK